MMSLSQVKALSDNLLAAAGITFLHDPTGDLRVPAKCPDVGDLVINFDDDEITVEIEGITHCHFTPYEASDSYEAYTIENCVRDVVSFVKEVVRDEWILWRSPVGAGGCYRIGTKCELYPGASAVGQSAEKFVWSGPLP